METCAIHSMRAPYKPSASLLGLSENAILCLFWQLLGWHCNKNRHAPHASFISFPADGLGVSEIGHFLTVNWIFGQHFSRNTHSVRASNNQFCP